MFIFQGERVNMTKAPYRYLLLPDQQPVALFSVPKPEDVEIDDDGILSNQDYLDMSSEQIAEMGRAFDVYDEVGGQASWAGEDDDDESGYIISNESWSDPGYEEGELHPA